MIDGLYCQVMIKTEYFSGEPEVANRKVDRMLFQ